MKPQLPKPIERYFTAENAGDAAALAACFTADGIVLDEKRSFRGPAAIRDWSATTKAKYHHTIEPLEIDNNAGRVTIKGRVSGNFPGSPVILSFNFRLADDKISHLEIG